MSKYLLEIGTEELPANFSHAVLEQFKSLIEFELDKKLIKYNKIVVGVNMLHLFKLITSIENDDTLTLYIENDDYTDGVVTNLGLKFENGDIKQCKTQKLRLIEPEPEELVYPDVKFSSVINLLFF